MFAVLCRHVSAIQSSTNALLLLLSFHKFFVHVYENNPTLNFFGLVHACYNLPTGHPVLILTLLILMIIGSFYLTIKKVTNIFKALSFLGTR